MPAKSNAASLQKASLAIDNEKLGEAESAAVPASLRALAASAAEEAPNPPTALTFRKGDGKKCLYLLAGIALLCLVAVIPSPLGMPPAAFKTIAVIAATVLWWATETLPMPVTALMIPVIVHAMGIMPLETAIREGLGTSLIPFTIGVLGLSAAFTSSGLGKRMTYRLLAVAGTCTKRVIGVFLWLSFSVSLFMDDLAVVAMFLPLVLGLLKTMNARPSHSNFGKALMMAIIFGSTLGGIATPAGVSANVITLAFLAKDADIHVGFLHWMAIATPIAIGINAACHWLILRLFPPEIKELSHGPEALRRDLQQLGPMKISERTTLAVGLIAVALWLASDWTKIPTAFVSLLILGGVCLPYVGVFRNWRDLSHHIEWGSLLLLAGGFVIGTAASKSGLAAWMVHSALYRMGALPHFLQPGAITLLTAIDSLGFASFGTTASVNVPFIIAYAQQNGLSVSMLGLATGFACSVHFILVTQSPSIALPYGSGYFRIKDLAKIGTVITLLAAVVITAGLAVASLFP
jgi:sodium-dependent dicarboxylate transporter 2/3/5